MTARSTLATALLATFAASCGPTHHDGAARPDGSSTGVPSDGVSVATRQCDKIDVVFVVDDSNSMDQEQDNLAANFPEFISILDQLRTPEGAPIDYRIALTTTGRDLHLVPAGGDQHGANGAFLDKASCGMTRPWIQRGDPNAASVFACAAKVGTAGPTVEMPMLMSSWALRERVADGKNASFLRPDALLGLVMITDENDCSQAQPNVLATDVYVCNEGQPEVISPQTIAATYDQVAGGHGHWAIAAIAGPGPGICESSFGRAAEATRLKTLVGLAGPNGVFSSICSGDLASPLRTALATFEQACGAVPIY